MKFLRHDVRKTLTVSLCLSILVSICYILWFRNKETIEYVDIIWAKRLFYGAFVINLVICIASAMKQGQRKIRATEVAAITALAMLYSLGSLVLVRKLGVADKNPDVYFLYREWCASWLMFFLISLMTPRRKII